MGHKKRNLASRSNGPSTSSTGSDPIPNTNSSANGAASSSGVPLSVVQQECERAQIALRRGNPTKSLRLIKEACAKYQNTPHSALTHRLQALLCCQVGAIIDDPNVKQRHIKNAIESARKAVELSPNSIEFIHYYAHLLLENSTESKEFEEVVALCKRALEIENPIDPADDGVQDEHLQRLSTSQERVLHVQNELRTLIQKSNLGSISTWMKHFGGEDRFRLIPVRRGAEDPMELRLVQARRPNEIKKANKTPEERRKEIEVRVAAARLLQQKSELARVEKLEEKGDRAVESNLGSGPQRNGDRRKNMRKNGSIVERKDLVTNYWNAMSLDMKKELLRINLSDLEAHFGCCRDGMANNILSEALSWAEVNKTWKFWACCRCDKKFMDPDSHMQHVVQDHLGNLLPKMQSVLPSSVDNNWAEMLHNCSWKPLDVSAAAKMLGNQLNCCGSEHLGSSYSSEDWFKDSWDYSPDKGNLDDECNSDAVEKNCCEKTTSIKCKECNGNQISMSDSLINKWPVSDDAERAKLLERIRVLFEILMRHKYLSGSHVSKVIKFSMDELRRLTSDSQLVSHGVDQTPLCICFLGALQLRKILNFLQDITQSCGLSRYSENISCPVEYVNSLIQEPEFKEKILLDGDASHFLLDERLLTASQGSDDHVAKDRAASLGCSNEILANSNCMLSWIFAGPTNTEHLSSWMRMKEQKKEQGIEILQMLEKEFFHLQNLCERKCEHLSYEEALQIVEDICLEESKIRETGGEYVHRSYESVLRKRRDELIENERDVVFISSRFELDAISNVLKDAESLNVNQLGCEESYSGLTSHLYDLESGEDDHWKTKDYLHQVDSSIEVAIQRQKEHLSLELSKIDARIMRNVTGMQQLELKLEPVSAYDYQSILLPLLKSYMRAHLEELAEKDATEKSDAAREAFLAELALDSNNHVKGGADNAKHTQEKPKDKKKNKDFRKSKDSKATSGTERCSFDKKNAEQASLLVPSDADHPDAELVVSAKADDLGQEEEEVRRRIELEAEERKLEETLEYQRRLENEAKQKLLAEQQKKITQACLKKGSGLQVFDSGCGTKQNMLGHIQPGLQEQLVHNNGLPNNATVPLNTSNGASVPNKSSASLGVQKTNGHQVKGEQNGAVAENGLSPSERRTGRRHRRQRNAAKVPDEKYQAISPNKDVINVRGTHNNGFDNKLVDSNDCLHVESFSPVGDNGTKTLQQLQNEEDDEERFQSDLQKAVRQSLDTFQAYQKLPLVSSRVQPKITYEAHNFGATADEHTTGNLDATDVLGTGLKNEAGEYNCFLNVIIQSLWHLKRFRDEFLRKSTSEHVHVGDPCVVCALHNVFTALSISSTELHKEAVAPTPLRIALSNLYPDSNFFQEAQMNDASEVLGVMFECLHQAFTSGLGVSDTESVESSCNGAWDCASSACIVHSLFGMDVFERMNCYKCGLESRPLKYTTFFHNINASALRTMKVTCPESSFDELLNFVEMNHQLACDPEVGGCGMLNYIHHILSKPPNVFTTVLGWQNTSENVEDIKATLSALSTEIDISALYRGLDPKNTRKLVSVVCYYGQHYFCFAYSHDHERWIMYDDKNVKVVGSWVDVLSVCERGHLQPQVLFFEDIN